MQERLRKFRPNFIQFFVTEMSNILNLSLHIVQVIWQSVIEMWCALDCSCGTLQVNMTVTYPVS